MFYGSIFAESCNYLDPSAHGIFGFRKVNHMKHSLVILNNAGDLSLSSQSALIIQTIEASDYRILFIEDLVHIPRFHIKNITIAQRFPFLAAKNQNFTHIKRSYEHADSR